MSTLQGQLRGMGLLGKGQFYNRNMPPANPITSSFVFRLVSYWQQLWGCSLALGPWRGRETCGLVRSQWLGP